VTRILVVDPLRPDAAALAGAGALLRAGRLVAFPTETVYGLGAHALDRAAVRRLFDAKGRPSIDPVIVHLAALDDAAPLVASMPPAALALARRFWPGPLTLVLPRSARIPDEVTAGLDTVGLRVPAHPVARALITAAAVPVAAPSANLFSRPSPTRAEHVLQDLDGRIDLVIDAGPTTVGVESTVLDLSGAVPLVLRPGAVTLDMLREVVPSVMGTERDSRPAAGGLRSPGLLDKHYAPRAPLTLYDGPSGADRLRAEARRALEAGQRVGLVAVDEDLPVPPLPCPPVWVAPLGPGAAVADVAGRLYAALRDLDRIPVDLILARTPPGADGLAVAIRDRLRRAAAGRIVPD
jgi:L-threonylcarbamoyladenylate synthase